METDFGPVCRQHLEFMKWADDIMLAALFQVPRDQVSLDLGNSFQSLFGTLNHVYLAELLWFRKLTGEPNTLFAECRSPVDLDELGAEWPALHQRWLDWSCSLSSEEWATVLVYKNLAGTESKLPYWQIVMHLVNHGSYHRGQVATMLRQSGIKPPGTDLAAFYRTR